MKVNIKKSNVTNISRKRKELIDRYSGQPILGKSGTINYLDSVITNDNSSTEGIKARIAVAQTINVIIGGLNISLRKVLLKTILGTGETCRCVPLYLSRYYLTSFEMWTRRRIKNVR